MFLHSGARTPAMSRRTTWILIKAIKHASITSRINQNARADSTQKRDGDVSRECQRKGGHLAYPHHPLDHPPFPYPAVDPMQTPTLISTYPHSGGRAFILINTQWISHPRRAGSQLFSRPSNPLWWNTESKLQHFLYKYDWFIAFRLTAVSLVIWDIFVWSYIKKFWIFI